MKIDLHIHTRFSNDGLDSPQEMVEAAISRGLDGLCIADHNEIEGAFQALNLSFSKPFLIIPGIEVKSKQGHILGINVKEKIPKGLSAQETIKEINRLGGLAVIAHPFAWPKGFRGNLESFIENLDYLIGIEVLNSAIPDFSNKKALELVKRFNLPFTAGSDAHETSTLGRAFLEIPRDCYSAEEVISEIKKRTGRPIGEKVSIFDKLFRIPQRDFRKVRRFFKLS